MNDFAPSYLYRWTFDLETGEQRRVIVRSLPATR